jgi:Zn-dependent protease with chaperone function
MGPRRVLIVGLPLLPVLTRAEMRAVLAHELAHLARGDASRVARATRFLDALERGLGSAAGGGRGLLGLWARGCHGLGEAWLVPVARGQEARADRAAAQVAGGTAAASALVKVALVQPLFHEVLQHYDPDDPAWPSLYGHFRDFWSRLPESVASSLRQQILYAARSTRSHGHHPALLDRLGWVQAHPDPPAASEDDAPATGLVGDLEGLERVLHSRLFATRRVEPSVFHRAGSR